MNDYIDPTEATDWQAAYDYADYAADHERHPWPPRDPRTPCCNPDCDQLCVSLYYTERCRARIEAPAEDAIDVTPRQLATAPVQVFGEAPVSITLKGLVHGPDVMITVRGVDFASVQAHVEAASQWLDRPSAAQPPAVQASAHLCPIHGVAMQQQTNARGSWWSHRDARGDWCKGKPTGPVAP